MENEFKVTALGRCRVIIAKEAGRWHLSISGKDFLPSYKEVKAARYKFLPDVPYMAEIFPPESEFVNVHPYCRHLWEIENK